MSKSLITETSLVLRKKIQEAESEIFRLRNLQAQAENNRLKLERRADAAEAQAEVLLSAVRLLADEVSNTTSAGRKARAAARSMLEKHKIHPPHTLGTSRAPRRRRKKSLTAKSVASTTTP